MSNITDSLSSLPTLKGIPSTGMGVVQRLISRVEEASKNDEAAEVQIGRRAAPAAGELGEVSPRRRRAIGAYADAVRHSTPTPPAEDREGFGPGKVIYGTFQDGKLQSRGGMEGSYEAFSAAGPIKFKLGEFEGYALGNYTGVAWNPKTGEMYNFKFKLDENHFTIGRFRPMNADEVPDRKLPMEGKISEGVANFDNGFKISMRENGQIEAELPAPDELKDADSDAQGKDPATRDGKILGKGFMDKNGNLVVAFDNGGTYHAKYEIKDGKLKILGYSALGV